MAEKSALQVDRLSLKKLLGGLLKIPENFKPYAARAVEWTSLQAADHMKREHFFIGTGKGSSKRAEEHVFTITNPDGSPRFKIRTNNLVRSIQARAPKVTAKAITARINVGMEYAADVEYGGPGRRAFPFIRPALEWVKPQFQKRLRQALVSALKARGGK